MIITNDNFYQYFADFNCIIYLILSNFKFRLNLFCCYVQQNNHMIIDKKTLSHRKFANLKILYRKQKFWKKLLNKGNIHITKLLSEKKYLIFENPKKLLVIN